MIFYLSKLVPGTPRKRVDTSYHGWCNIKTYLFTKSNSYLWKIPTHILLY